MNKRFFEVAFAIGLLAVIWVGAGFVGHSALALAMTLLIGAVYGFGAYELRQFRAASASLGQALADIAQPPPSLDDWLGRVPAGLRHAVRLRIEGERVGLPGPALTPYLVGLLVMLGMLGTFLGMVVTFKGAVFALEGSADLQAMRGALAAPLQGLGLSFGTSVAGVAASAMLGLMSAYCRRERLEMARQLDARVAGVLRPFSLAHQREARLRALQAQAEVLPAVVERLDALMTRLEQRSQQLDEQLLGRQAQFQREASQSYTDLARHVGTSLQESLVAGARAAGESIRPVVESAMTQVVQESRQLHERLGETAQMQVDALSAQFAATARTASDGWVAASQAQARTSEATAQRLESGFASVIATFEERSTALLASVGQSQAALREEERERGEAAVARLGELQACVTQQLGELQACAAQNLGELQATATQNLGELRATTTQHLGELQATVAQHLGALGTALEAPLTRMLQTAVEVPQAAAGVITQLREAMSRMAERDNQALDERTQMLERFGALLQSVNQGAGEQRCATEALVAAASSVLAQAGERFAQTLEAQSGRAGEAATHVAASAVELASLGEAFGQAVAQFQAANEQLVDGLQRIEGSINRSTTRSDEQLAYYVAQAREVIDLSIASQQGLVDQVRQMQARPQALAEEAR